MVKLSQQLKDQRFKQQAQPTRTQRVAQKQAIQRNELERQRFEDLKAQAQKKQEELAGASFEEYSQEYSKLPPNLKQFFSTPQEVLDQKAQRIEDTKATVQEKIAYADQKIAERTAYYNQKIADKKSWWSSKPSSYRHDPKRKENYKEDLDDYEDDLEEDIAKYQGLKKGLSKGLNELNQNKDVQYSDIESYAWDVANYEESKQEARNENRKIKNKQQDEIRKLEEAGFKPYVIEKSFKGNPESVALSYYNENTGQWKNVANFDSKGKIDVSKLNKVGYSQPTQRSLTFAGKDYNFTSRVGIYKEADGDLVTPYAETGLNENVLIKQQQDKAFEEWKQTAPAKQFNLPFKVIPAKDLPVGYGGQQSISSEPVNVVMDEKLYYQQQDQKKFDFGLSKAVGGVVSGFKWVDDRFHFTGDLKTGGIKFGKLDKPTNPELASQMGVDYLAKKSQDLEDWAIGKDKIENFEQTLETKYQGQYQASFEQKYMKGLIYNETNFDDAKEEFATSDEAKLIQRRYQEEFKTGYKDLQVSPSMLKKWGAGSGRVGLGLGSFGLKVVSTPTKTATATAGVLTGVKVLGAIPSVVSYSATGGLFAYGTYKAVSPTSTIDEAGSGLVTAVLTGATLGYAGYKYLKSPVVKTVKIKAPKMDLKSTGMIGKDITVIKDGVTSNKVVYHSQKLSQTGTAGSRTIVTTKGRVLSNSFWRAIGVKKKFVTLDSNAIYRGIPTEQLGKAYKIQSIRGTTNVVVGKSGYQKALLKLTKYGWTDAQAKATLRYTAPRVYESYLNKGIITVKGAKATAYFEHLVKRPVINVNSNLGIKTRGGADLKTISKIQRQLVKDASGNTFSKYSGVKASGFVDKAGKFKDWREVEFASGKTFVKAFDQKGFEYLGKQGGVEAWKTNQAYKDLFAFSKKDALKIKLTKTRSNLGVEFDYNPVRNLEGSNAKLYNQIIDLDKGNKWVKPANIKKTPFSKTFGSDKADDVAFTFTKDQSKTSDAVKKVMDKIDDLGASPQQSKYFGQGQYEQSLGGLSPKEILQNQNLLKTHIDAPTVKVGTGIKSAILVKQLELSNVGNLLAIGNVAGLKVGLKQAPQLKTDLKSNIKLKDLLKEDIAVKTAQIPDLKTSPALKSQLKSLLNLETPTTSINPPSTAYRPPKIPTYNPPRPKPIVIPFLNAKVGKGSQPSLKKLIYDKAYLPDFTSRSLGLAPETVSQKQAQKKLKQLLTGLEIRRGVTIK